MSGGAGGYRVSAMRRNKVVVAAAAVVVLLVVGGVVAVAAYGRGQPVVVDEPGPGPVGWFENGLEHLTGNAQDRTDRVDESIDGNGAAWMGPVMLVVVAAGVVAVGWLVVDHRRRQRT